MKKFFTVIPLQPEGKLNPCHYEAVGNSKLQMEEETRFPILPAINGYTEQGEKILVIAVTEENNDDCRRNRAFLEEEIDELCTKKGIRTEIRDVFISAEQKVSAHAETFRKLIDYVEDDDELFACMTYGTKPVSKALMMALQYAYRVKKNASISCLVYGQMDRRVNPPKTYVYDETALLQLDELVRVLADRGTADPKAAIDAVLSM